MEHEFTDPRHSPRAAADSGPIVALHVSMPVRLLDLSPEGLLLACEVPLRAGSTVRVVTGHAGRRLDVELCVDQVSNQPDERVGGYVLDGRIPSFDPAARGTIAALLGASLPRTAGEPAPRVARGRWESPASGGVQRQRPVRRLERPRPERASWISSAL